MEDVDRLGDSSFLHARNAWTHTAHTLKFDCRITVTIKLGLANYR
jgi:hypothetical protein